MRPQLNLVALKTLTDKACTKILEKIPHQICSVLADPRDRRAELDKAQLNLAALKTLSDEADLLRARVSELEPLQVTQKEDRHVNECGRPFADTTKWIVGQPSRTSWSPCR